MKRRLLVVDDNPGYRRLVCLALEGDPGFEVVGEAATPEEVATIARRLHPDIVLVDVLLPAGQGLRLPALLRELVPGCLVVLTSAHPEGDLDAIRQLGGVAFLPKSVAPSLLGRELGALVGAAGGTPDVVREAVVQLPPSNESPRMARRFVERTLEGWGLEKVLDTVTLLVSELVGNAVLHAGSEVGLTLRQLADRLRVDVADRSTEVPHRREADDDDLTGRGSDLVEIMATAWGISGRPDGKSVWFEVALPPGLTDVDPALPGPQIQGAP